MEVITSRLYAGKAFLVKVMMFAGVVSILLIGLIFLDPELTSGIAVVLVLIMLAMSLAVYQLFASLQPYLATVAFQNEYLEIRQGFSGAQKKLPYAELEGYKKQLIPANRKAYNCLIIVSNGRSVADISSQYTQNLDDIEAALSEKIPYLGKEPYKPWKSMVDRMLRR